MDANRPFPVTLLAFIVLVLAVLNGVRFGAGVFNWALLTAYTPHPGPIYITLTGLFWCIAGFLSFTVIWRMKPIGWYAAWLFCLSFAASYWLDRLIIQNNPARANIPFAIGITILFIIYTLLTLIGSKSHFLRGTHERKNQD